MKQPMSIHTPPRPVPVIGLLGGPGSGKSHVAHALAKLGAAVIDADAIAREVLDDATVRGTLTAWWGSGVLRDNGRIDRAEVGRRVFDHPAELARLESLVHPRVNARRNELRRRYRDQDGVTAIVEDCPLLLERGLEGDCDVLVFVDAPQATRHHRVHKTRGWSEEELARREKNQLPLDIKRGRADYVVDNGPDAVAVEDQARRLLDWAVSRTG